MPSTTKANSTKEATLLTYTEGTGQSVREVMKQLFEEHDQNKEETLAAAQKILDSDPDFVQELAMWALWQYITDLSRAYRLKVAKTEYSEKMKKESKNSPHYGRVKRVLQSLPSPWDITLPNGVQLKNASPEDIEQAKEFYGKQMTGGKVKRRPQSRS